MKTEMENPFFLKALQAMTIIIIIIIKTAFKYTAVCFFLVHCVFI